MVVAQLFVEDAAKDMYRSHLLNGMPRRVQRHNGLDASQMLESFIDHVLTRTIMLLAIDLGISKGLSTITKKQQHGRGRGKFRPRPCCFLFVTAERPLPIPTSIAVNIICSGGSSWQTTTAKGTSDIERHEEGRRQAAQRFRSAA